MILKNKQKMSSVISEEDLLNSKILDDIYDYYQFNPLNNILHNKTTKFIMGLMSLEMPKVKKRISQNEKLFKILEKISMNMDSNQFRQQNCYLGHMKKLANYFHGKDLKNEVDERWLGFRDRFLKLENEKENKALGDVYVNNDDDADDIVFLFSMEEVKEKYKVFLGFTVEEENKNNETTSEDEQEVKSKEDDSENQIDENQIEVNQEANKEENEETLTKQIDNEEVNCNFI